MTINHNWNMFIIVHLNLTNINDRSSMMEGPVIVAPFVMIIRGQN